MNQREICSLSGVNSGFRALVTLVLLWTKHSMILVGLVRYVVRCVLTHKILCGDASSIHVTNVGSSLSRSIVHHLGCNSDSRPYISSHKAGADEMLTEPTHTHLNLTFVFVELAHCQNLSSTTYVKPFLGNCAVIKYMRVIKDFCDSNHQSLVLCRP